MGNCYAQWDWRVRLQILETGSISTLLRVAIFFHLLNLNNRVSSISNSSLTRQRWLSFCLQRLIFLNYFDINFESHKSFSFFTASSCPIVARILRVAIYRVLVHSRGLLPNLTFSCICLLLTYRHWVVSADRFFLDDLQVMTVWCLQIPRLARILLFGRFFSLNRCTFLVFLGFHNFGQRWIEGWCAHFCHRAFQVTIIDRIFYSVRSILRLKRQVLLLGGDLLWQLNRFFCGVLRFDLFRDFGWILRSAVICPKIVIIWIFVVDLRSCLKSLLGSV